MLLSPNVIVSKLAQHQPYPIIYLAYSGGIDSHVLLHLCASIDNLKPKITAVYVNHGLQVEAKNWGLHCGQVCANLGVKFLSLKANAKAAPGESPEEAARNARYAALKPLLGKDDMLLLAQHGEDQLETVLLQLFRGSGLKGLSGMPESMAFGEGRLVRPLLDVSKAQIIEYAKSHALEWVEDPSNRHSRYDRNFLRNDIIPLLKQRWPALDKTVFRSAKHCANSDFLLAAHAEDLLRHVLDQKDKALIISNLKTYSLLEQQLIIRQWFNCLGLKMPSQDFVEKIVEQVVGARDDANPVLAKQDYCIRRYRNKLYCVKSFSLSIKEGYLWPFGQSLLKVTDEESYEVVHSETGIPLEQWQNSTITVKFRSGGESVRLPGREGRHALKNLFQEAGIPPWERIQIPLIFLDDQLAAVGERWITAEYYSESREPCIRIIRRKINPKGNDGMAVVG
ncbi:MAG: tRNA lysidine(34) synthetase TilS [Methylococcaceae bacterium]|nr:tRNA lysidine(34) synthetase TilS [Methylococcaceae bacterium]